MHPPLMFLQALVSLCPSLAYLLKTILTSKIHNKERTKRNGGIADPSTTSDAYLWALVECRLH